MSQPQFNVWAPIVAANEEEPEPPPATAVYARLNRQRVNKGLKRKSWGQVVSDSLKSDTVHRDRVETRVEANLNSVNQRTTAPRGGLVSKPMVKRIVRSPLAWIGAVAILTAVLLGVFNGATLAFAAVAAFGSVAAVAVGSKSATEQKQMADDLSRLAELTESSIEEARAQRPEPIVRFLTGANQSVDAMRIERTRLDREIDVEAIIETERRRAMATLPVEPAKKKDAASPTALPGFEGVAEAVRRMEQVTRATSLFGAGYNARAPATPEERTKFEKQVDEYVADLRDWLAEYPEWRDETGHLVRFPLRFENLGRVPCQGARIDVHFPDPFDGVEEDDYPVLDAAPARPRFHRRSPWNLGGLSTFPVYEPRIPSLRGVVGPQANVSRPRYRKGGSVHVEISVTKLLHGRYEDCDPISLRAPADGTYAVPWMIWAENLAQPAHGELQLDIATRIETGGPITQLDELLPQHADEDES